MGAEDVTDQPRDIHGTPIYVGDRVAIATTGLVPPPGAGEDEEYPELIVRLVTEIDQEGFVVVAEPDVARGCWYTPDEVSACFLRLP